MQKLLNWITEVLAPKIKKTISIPWLAAIASTMQKILPFILVGSIVSIYNVFVRYIPALPSIAFVNTFSFGFISVFVTFLVAYQGMIEYKHEKFPVTAGLTAIATYFVVMCPNIAKSDLASFSVEDMNYFGGKGLFVAIMVGVFVMVIFHLVAKLHLLEDSDSLPDFVCEWINNIIPITFILLSTGIVVFNFHFDIFGLITTIFQPLCNIGQTLPGFIIICFLYVFLYSVGISAWSLNAIVKPILVAGISANEALYLAGKSPVNIVTTETIFTTALIAMGGLGGTLPLNIMMFKAKSRKLRAMAKISVGPSIFNINEPLVYGTIVFNPLLMIPMWLNSVIGAIVIWIIMRGGLLNIPAGVNNVSRIPAPICTWLTTNDWRAFIWFFVLFAMYFVIYFPFFRKYDNQLAKEEGIQTAK
ncbi:PTS sugar transporter subunit IIC [Anaerocolumna sp. MB42-C2]|uniref:PTS sugar transporter subunit IIC n=1 Tax=Anaerocolumna sp. MB42-C2 TaxID=3070997 RepID=UPI0027E1640B|nr:PTS transporter subunit EIIC [Anaerocolumna sp. MB42-C2]WMJ89234.1 PTS transporter subunit EIIC [Anaerocolumna sp. MB42-C2]